MRQCSPPVLGGWSQGLTPMERYMYLPIRFAGFGIVPKSALRRFAQPNSLVSLMPRLLPARHLRREVLVPPELSKSSIHQVNRSYRRKFTFPRIRLLQGLISTIYNGHRADETGSICAKSTKTLVFALPCFFFIGSCSNETFRPISIPTQQLC